jgi:hypothetical protein
MFRCLYENRKVYILALFLIIMARYRIVKNYPTSGWIIRLKQQDITDLNLKDGDLIDIEDAVVKTSISKSMAKQLKVKTK